MPIYSLQNVKLFLANEDKTKTALLEYPKDMTLQDLLERVDELRETILKSIEAEKNAKIKEETPEAKS